MTTYTSYDEVYGQLNASWNTGVIAKPTFFNGKQGGNDGFSRISIDFSPSIADISTAGNNSRDNINTLWEMRLMTDSKVNVDKYLGECRRIINGYSLTNGYWHVDSWKLVESGRFFIYECICSEVLWDFA